LVVARDKCGERSSTLVKGTDGSPQYKVRAQFDQYEDDLDTIRNQLEHERQRCKKLQEELKDMSKERADEASSFRSKQVQYDRQLADMSVTISRLQSNIRDAKREYSSESAEVDPDEDNVSQIKNLSEQAMKQQEKLVQYGSELAAMKNRLQVAINRADQAELALAIVEADTSRNPYDVEGAPSSGGMRRRGGIRGSKMEGNGGSIRSAFLLSNPQNQQAETVGKAIDAIDGFAVQTGKFLRSNPLARGGFLLYLIILHLWTFFVLFLHTHNYEPVHGDFGAGQQLAHSPNALMQQQALIQQELSQDRNSVIPMKVSRDNAILVPKEVVNPPQIEQGKEEGHDNVVAKKEEVVNVKL
jgi:Golgin subfamily A member 5